MSVNEKKDWPEQHLVFADLPYGVTANKWDTEFPLHDFWANTINKMAPLATVTMSATMPFAAKVVISNIKQFRHDIVWSKSRPSGFLNAKKCPLRSHELILVFARKLRVYNPQMVPASDRQLRSDVRITQSDSVNYGLHQERTYSAWKETGQRYPRSVLNITNMKSTHGFHPTQKPVALLDWLIRTYSNEGNHILDPVSGSGTTAIAALMSGRNVTCIEKDLGYFDASVERVQRTIKDHGIAAELDIRR